MEETKLDLRLNDNSEKDLKILEFLDKNIDKAVLYEIKDAAYDYEKQISFKITENVSAHVCIQKGNYNNLYGAITFGGTKRFEFFIKGESHTNKYKKLAESLRVKREAEELEELKNLLLELN